MTSETPQTPAAAPRGIGAADAERNEASGAPRESAPPATGAPRPMGGGPRGPRPGGGSRPFGPPGTRRPRRKVCVFCLEKVKRIDYKDKPRLQRFLSDRAKIDPRRKSGNCAKHQRMLTTALKRARYMALLPYTAEHVRAMMSPSQRALAGGPPPARPERYGPRPPYAPRPEGPRIEGGGPGAGGAPRPAEPAVPRAVEPAGPRPEPAAAPRPEPGAPRAEGSKTEAS